METAKDAPVLPSTTSDVGLHAAAPISVAYVTVPPDRAEELASALVESGLVACVNIVPGLTSVYRWRGKIEKDSESLLIIKTRASLQRAVTLWVQTHHPYETPEVIFLPVQAGNPAYLAWVRESTAAAGAAAADCAPSSAAGEGEAACAAVASAAADDIGELGAKGLDGSC